MLRLSIILIFFFIAIAQSSYANKAITATDSLVDVFPLSIGNQWTYGYYWEYNDAFQSHPMYHWCDTGTVIIRIIGKVSTPDSTCWSIREESKLCSQYNNMPFSDPQIVIDTFEIIEMHNGNYPIYSKGSRFATANSVFPFPLQSPYPFNEQDTTEIERFRPVDSVGVAEFDFWGDEGYLHRFTFKQGAGLQSVTTSSLCLCGETWSGNHVLRNSIINSVSPLSTDGLPHIYYLAQNFPNPFNPSTIITFILPSHSFVTLNVFDCLGREVVTLASENLAAGVHSKQWDASGLPSGIYLYRLQTNTFTETKKLVLLK
jgi:hypothetical protein